MKEVCAICSAPLVRLEDARTVQCAVCGRTATSTVACENGHFVCDECRASGMDAVVGVCLQEAGTDPIALVRKLMALPFCRMHGPEHHILVGSALLTAYKNAGGAVDLPLALREMQVRGKKVPGGACGTLGACGAAVSAGTFVAIVTGSTPLAREAWGLSNRMTGEALLSIGEIGGPRCCKRDSYRSILTAVEFAARHLGVQMQCAPFSCIHWQKNDRCIGDRCPFFA